MSGDWDWPGWGGNPARPAPPRPCDDLGDAR